MPCQKTIARIAVAATSLVLLTACGSSAGSTDTTPARSSRATPTPTATPSARSADSLPASLQGTWLIDRTRAEMVQDLRKAGFGKYANAFFEAEHLGQRAVVAVTFEADQFQVSWLNQDGSWQVGWYGEARAHDGVLTVTDAPDHSDNSYTWSVRNGLLTLRYRSTTTPDQKGIPFEAYNRAYFTRPLRAAKCTPEDLDACL